MEILKVIFVTLIEATKVLIPVEAKEIGEGAFFILSNSQFDPEDNSSVFESLPGDTVSCKLQAKKDFKGNEEQVLVVDSVIRSTYPNRNFYMLKFLIVNQEGKLTQEQLVYFERDLEKLRKEVTLASSENPFHPAILRWFDRV